MALQSPFFNKREPDNYNARPNPGAVPGGSASSAPATAAAGAGASAAITPANAAAASGPKDVESKLTVGPNIKLKGVEIDDCDTLVVEGRVEATMVSRAIQIAEQGSFKGTADIEVAEIRGAFEGELTARGRLVIHATGRVTGKVRYGRLLVQEGGEITGDVGTLGARDPAGRVA